MSSNGSYWRSAVTTFSVLAWTIGVTYKEAPPFPDRFVTTDGTVLMTAADIQAGKAGFQKADLMDYGSLYGMGSILVLTILPSIWCVSGN